MTGTRAIAVCATLVRRFAALLVAIGCVGCPGGGDPPRADGGPDVDAVMDARGSVDVVEGEPRPACPRGADPPLMVVSSDPSTGCPTVVARFHYWTGPCGDCDPGPICCSIEPACTFTLRVSANGNDDPMCAAFESVMRESEGCRCVDGVLSCPLEGASAGCLDCPECFSPPDE